jgi:hypothetical protein
MGSSRGTHGIETKCIQRFGKETRKKSSLRRLRHSWECNIKIDC